MKYLNRRTLLIAVPLFVALAVLLCVRLAIAHPQIVEKYYSDGIYPVIAAIFSAISGMVPFSIYDFFWLLTVILVLTGLVLVAFRTIRLKWYLLRVFQASLVVYSLFYLLWGFNYFRPSIDKRLGWRNTMPAETMFRTVLDSLISNSNKYFTVIDGSECREMDELLEKSYGSNGMRLGITSSFGKRRPKTIFLSSWFARTGISGYFGPFFNEVHINQYQLPVDYAFVLGHEKAHQFGIASEAEANLASFIVCTASPDRRLKYSGYTHILLYFLTDARQLSDYSQIIRKIDRRVMEDLVSREKYYEKLRNEKLEKVQTAANNVFLKTNHISQGVRNYNQVVGLTIGWYCNSALTEAPVPEFAQTIKN